MMLTLSDMPGKEDIIFELDNFYQQQAAQAAAVPPVGG
jgi:hypothetical protein